MNGNLKSESRRDFLKMCSAVAAVLGLGPGGVKQIAAAIAAGNRPSVLWLHFAECTGCTEAVLRLSNPFFDDLIMNTISLDYHETLMAAAGSTVEDILTATAQANQGKFFCVVEGSIPTANNGVYGMVGGRTMLAIAQDVCPKAAGIIAIGACASYGGLPAAAPNPTGAKGVKDALPSLTVPVVNCPGCPPNPVTFAAIIVNYLLKGTFPTLDANGRPTFAYGQKIHPNCPFLDTSRCLFDEGCKGPRCYNTCPTTKFNDGTSFPMQAGHPCIGCAQPNFWDTMSPFYSHRGTLDIRNPRRPTYPPGLRPEDVRAERFDLLGRRIDGGLSRRELFRRGARPGASGLHIVRDAKEVAQKQVGL